MPPRKDKVDTWMPWFPRDFLTATDGLSTVDGYAYARLLMHAWLEHGYLPYDPAELARLAKVTPLEWLATWSRISTFWDVAEGKISNRRLLYEREQALANRQEASEKGRRAAAARWEKTQGSRAAKQDARALPEQCPSPSPSPSPSPAEEIPPTPRRRGACVRPETEAFRTWIDAYPVQVDRDRAWTAWQEVEAELPPVAAMLATLTWQKRLEFDRRPPDRVPYPATYLRKRRWTDKEPRTSAAAPSSPPTPSRTRINGQHVCYYHREIPDKAAPERDPLCHLCNRLGTRRARSTVSEPVPLGAVGRTPP